MTAVVFYFQVHQPYRLRRNRGTGTRAPAEWFDDAENERILRRVADRCYVPVNKLLLDAIDEHGGSFRCAFSISGTALDQMEAWAPDALESFVALAETGCVEFLAETSHHSLAFFGDREEFRAQVANHRARIAELFGRKPTTFRNTELVISPGVAREAERLGFDAILGEGAEQLLGWRSPHFPYRPRGCRRIVLLLRDFQLSDDIAFRFSNREWPHWPLMADTFASWLHDVPEQEPYVGLFMDYETFGEHQSAEDTGVLEFLRRLPGYLLEREGTTFATPADVAAATTDPFELEIPRPVSWADAERDLSAWLTNPMQAEAHRALYERREHVLDDPELLAAWRKLTTSDHAYYMCTKLRSDGDVHEYFSPYYSPHDAFVLFMRTLDELDELVKEPRRAGRVRGSGTAGAAHHSRSRGTR